ncbi:PhoH family protein [Aestuariirhabdus litorea]|uniref:PhoH family protein n=1 Tax=Aestuariirhabdus litorea TaxID=2528527 RepID=A0A3P3VPA7_9GAMM|nr:PhoH family protein [Aestuariirhabdus litorea]RRJ83748.1 PhoH family protein [Aestuariirhabdus litorea]RWW96971.1 PhoH family protein [Endozoicomonadaceae bacterium GTF-13]
MDDAIKLDLIPSENICYILDTNVLIHDPNAIFNFEEHRVMIPMIVLEELDKLKTGKHTIAADCRQAIRQIDSIVGNSTPEEIDQGVPIPRADKEAFMGCMSILTSTPASNLSYLPSHINDNKIINDICQWQASHPNEKAVLVTKDINMRLKARGCGLQAEDYENDKLVSDVELLNKGYIEVEGSFWDLIDNVETSQLDGETHHRLQRCGILKDVYPNTFIIDEQGFVGRAIEVSESQVTLLHLSYDGLMHQEAWGLHPQDIYQAIALHLLLDPDVHLVNLTGSAGSGKTILALAAAIEMTVANKLYRRIIATRSTQGLDEDIGFLPGTEAEKMEPWLGAITDNLEALHCDDENTHGSVDYILNKVPLHFKSLNYIRGRSFQHSLILIDESQNLTPHQIKTIITRAGNGSKVICLGNLAQIDTPYLGATSSGLTYMTERFKDFSHGGNVKLQGVPRSLLAEFAESHL